MSFLSVVIEDERGVEEHRWRHDLDASILSADAEGACLQFVDAYGDTVFNQLQIPVLVVELMNLVLDLEDKAQADLLEDLVRFVRRAEDQPHTYVRFLGD